MASLKRFDGYLSIDHRASPGLPVPLAERMGLPLQQVREGGLMECATMTCAHCSTVVIPNPERTRERGYCASCDRYVCDHCKAASLQAGYVHYSWQQILDMVKSGRFAISGSPSAPILVPITAAPATE
jgi:hypothetical protein